MTTTPLTTKISNAGTVKNTSTPTMVAPKKRLSAIATEDLNKSQDTGVSDISESPMLTPTVSGSPFVPPTIILLQPMRELPQYKVGEIE